jgi:heterodisulfide reductase subunit A
MGVTFIRYSLERLPQVEADQVKAYDEISQKELALDYDLVVLATPLVADEDNQKLAKMFSIPTDQFGFLIEPQIKLRPNHFVPNGVFIAGAVHFPANIDECVLQGQSAAAKVLSFLNRGNLEREPFNVAVNELLCRGCGRCVEVCEFNAVKNAEQEDGSKLAVVDPLLCKGCGMCAVNCISGALEVVHLTDVQMDAMIEAVDV